MDLLGEDLLKLLGSGLLNGLRDLAGASGVADLAGLGVRTSVVNGVREFVLELGGSLKYGVRMNVIKKRITWKKMYLLLNLAGDLRVGGVGNTLAAFVLHVDRCGCLFCA